MQEAGIGSRAVNFIVDTLLIFLLAYGLYEWRVFYVKHAGYKYFAFPWVFFATLFCYYSFFEILFCRTPGKWLSMTKVKQANYLKPLWYQIIFRSMLRLTVIDLFFFPFFEMPLHDLLSKTRVTGA